MILQRLAEHYDRMIASGDTYLPLHGSSQQKMSFCIVLNPDGTLNQFESMLQQEGKRLIAQSLIVPGQSKPTGQGINPCLLWDNAAYLLGYTALPENQERAKQTFRASREKHLALEDAVHHPSYSAVCRFMEAWSPELAGEHPELAESTTNFGVFRIAGATRFVHQEVNLPDTESKSESSEEESAFCLVSGERAPAARLHEPKIKGVAGAQSSGALLVSFNASAFTSYGKDQSFNAPVSTSTVFKYANALNRLLQTRSVRLGDMTFVYWADHSSVVENLFGLTFTGTREEQSTKEDEARVKEAKLLLSQVRSGTQNSKLDLTEGPTKFYILGLSPNASRLSVRIWIEADAEEIFRRLRAHVDDFALKGGSDELPPPLWLVAVATGRAEHDANGRLKSYDSDSVSPLLAGELARSVLTGAPYPQSLLAAMVRRIQADGEISSVRVRAIKACLIRNTQHTATPLRIPMELDTDYADIPYRCGRLFAILEKAQSDSLGGDLNSTIKDRYFSSASVTPGFILPRLFRLNVHHLNKLERPSKIFYERLIGSIMSGSFDFPKRQSLAEQGRFVIGYFQQRQDLYTKKQEKAEEN
ncbi:type I-C CRISPR-associated protein Cas8c/Csd1 [Granulicella cerasi]|uniref:Type I-C CRISPR-associated protein Cas8c/Csd1 n=1 Tax=Granulicella cerasi TaxID=741063 RepID=A0ABW1Z8T0_9BACT|nr:type I-C CRISPR-associated protein Cas8c/Csd1 [Granulicella cerasi]